MTVGGPASSSKVADAITHALVVGAIVAVCGGVLLVQRWIHSGPGETAMRSTVRELVKPECLR